MANQIADYTSCSYLDVEGTRTDTEDVTENNDFIKRDKSLHGLIAHISITQEKSTNSDIKSD
jgi:hypothetical protein